MKRRLMQLACMLGLAVNCGLAADATKPNVVLILVDDFGFECLSANGSDTYKTPYLDRLAAGGMRFENCHVQPLCTPTRIQLMTGQYNIRNYVEFGYMQPKERTFANLFHDAGYATAIVGKWQLGRELSLPKRWGFDEHCLWQFTRIPERYKNAGLEINGKEVDYTKGEFGPDQVSDYALDFITRNKSRPFLLYYPMMLTHGPFVPTPDSPDYARPLQKKSDDKYFAGMVQYADKLIGKLAARLDELNLREKTVILVVGDNGTGAGVTSQFRGKKFVGGKGQGNHAGTHVPLVVNWPKTIPSGKVNANLVDSTDFLPTLCDLAGVRVPSDMTVDGKSFWPQLQGVPNAPAREWIYSWYAPRQQELKFEFAQNAGFKLYRDGRFFDLRSDLDETKPLAVNTLPGDAKSAHANLSKVLDQFKNARPQLQSPEVTPKKARAKGKNKTGNE